MKRLLPALAAMTLYAPAQVPVTPIVQPHATFVDQNGSPCSLCKLGSYVAGTTTAQPTYTDSSGTSQNTNPITLDVAGGANIWVGTTNAYKFVLKDALGNTIWTVDNVKGNASGGLGTCATANAITYAVPSTSTFGCDATITINPTLHSIQVGGVIAGPYFALTNLATIPTSWTMDVTTPGTALSSMGLVPLNDLATQVNDTVVMNATGSTGSPTAVAMPTGCALAVNYNTTTHTWSCAATAIPLTYLATQAADTVVMNATGSAAGPTAVVMPTGCTGGVNYNTTTHAWTCATTTPPTCTGTTPPYSCYRITGDGLIEEWGRTAGCGTGSNNDCTVRITFPYAFTNYVDAITVTPNSANTGPSEGNVLAMTYNVSTSAFTVRFGATVQPGGGGYNLDPSVTAQWQAKGR